MNSVAIATCHALPDGDEDAEILRAALLRHTIDADWRVWHDTDVDWSAYAMTVVRSTWDYTRDRAAFLAWARTVHRLHNPADVLEWNTDKTYLRELESAGISIVATEWARPGQSIRLPTKEFVIKPSVGAGSKGAGRFDPAQNDSEGAARAHIQALHAAGRTVMIQPYLEQVDALGETALIYMAGTYSHAVRKTAMLSPQSVVDLDPGYSRSLFVEERISTMSPSAAELVLGAEVVKAVESRFGQLLYARIDLLPTPEGPVLIELELAEPSLFLMHDSLSADRLAAAIADLLSAG